MSNYVTVYNCLKLLYSIESTFTIWEGKVKLIIKVAALDETHQSVSSYLCAWGC